VLPFLRRRGIETRDGFVASHLDLDHAGGAAAVLRGIAVDRVLSSIPAGHRLLGGRPAVERYQAGQSIQSGELKLTVIHPAANDHERRRPSNAMSCVVRVELGAATVLLTGDIPADVEAVLPPKGLRVDLLMAPHDGSRSSSSAALLDAAEPGLAFAQSGYRNLYGHPDPAVVQRCRLRNLELLRTDRSGALQWRFRSDGRFASSAARASSVRYWIDRPFAGQEMPGEIDGAEADDELREPLSGMP